ncbi:MAG: protein kinase [Chitinispirillaceae bacterium]|nr:protein kinase [Chitinispirillaceae bacterium]
MDPAEKPPVPEEKKYGRYVVQKLLGEGAMGKVYLAQDPVLNRQVAIKVIAVERQLDPETRREFLSRFALEARLSAQLNHPSIVPVYDAGEEGGVPWIAFQYIDGVTLDKIIRNKGKLSVKWSVHITLDIASALQLAHSQHIVHRDIKPGNIIVDRHGGVAKLADFGVAKVPWASLTCEGNAMGSPGYMSPEQIEGFSIDERSDLFSLGVVLYEMLTGRHPFVRETVAATAFATMSGKYAQAGELATGIPKQLDEIIGRCLTPKPDQRIKTAGQLIELLRKVAPVADQGTTGLPLLKEEGRRGPHEDLFKRILQPVHALFGRLERRSKPPPTLVSARIKPSTRRSSRLVTQGRNMLRMALFTFRKGAVRLMKRLPDNAPIYILGSIAGIGLAVIILLAALAGKKQKEALVLPLTGLDAEQKVLVSKSQSWAKVGKYDSAVVYATALSLTEEGAMLGHFLRGIIACQQGNHTDAFVAFEAAEELPSGEKLVEKNSRYIVNLCLPALKEKRASNALVSILATKCSAADVSEIKNGPYEKPYWMRWNCLRILQAAGRQVDLVRVFILDLKYAGSSRTRVKAIRDLGELGDPRAVPALKEAKKKGMRDPFVSSAAAKVLKKVFKEK